MPDLLVKQLIEFGLSEKEAKVYLALLELEVATVRETAKTADINRSSTYVVLESLKKKGLVSTSEDKKIQRYVAVSPDMLLLEAKNRFIKSEEIKNKISDIIPELKALYKDTKQKPKVSIFEGKQGLINSFEDTLHNKEKIMRVCSSAGNLFKVLPDYFPGYVQRRIKLGIKMYGIHPNDEILQKVIDMAPESSKFDKSIFIPKKKYHFSADVAIYDNKIGYISPNKEGFAIIIEDKEMADAMKNLFDLAYEKAKRLNKSINKKRQS